MSMKYNKLYYFLKIFYLINIYKNLKLVIIFFTIKIYLK